MLTLFLYTLIPTLFALVGGGVAMLYQPKGKFVSLLQHFVSGIVIGAVALEILPQLLHPEKKWTISLGFILGAAVMLILRKLSDRLAKKGTGLILASCIDLLVDGVLIALSFLAGQKVGIVIALSLSFCAFFLAMTISATLKKKRFLATLLLAAMLPIGALIGGSVLAALPHAIFIETLAFGVAALLYLGVEELLGEAHQIPDTNWMIGAFFLGFWVILLFT